MLTKVISKLALIILLTSCGIQSIPRQMNEVDAAWSEVLNQYQRRADLVPNLVNVVKGFAKHESETLNNVVKARAEATQIKLEVKDLTEENLAKFQKAQDSLQGALSKLLAISENYPTLKADQGFRDLQTQLEGTENRIAVARNRYIESIKEFNNLVTVFPTSLTNSVMFHHSPKAQFTVSEGVQANPEVKF